MAVCSIINEFSESLFEANQQMNLFFPELSFQVSSVGDISF